MSEEMSPRLGLPLLQPGQAQKEADHNEALALLDLATQAAVAAVGVDTPPTTADEGACWVVGTAPSGAWSGHDDALAGWTAGGWRFVAAREGMAVWSEADGCDARFRDGAWRIGELAGATLAIDGIAVVGGQRPAIAGASGGGVIDAEARTAVDAILAALRAHGLIAT